MSDCELLLVDREQLSEMWMDVRHWIAKACADEGGSYEPGDILMALAKEDMRLWIVREDGKTIAAAVTEIREHPRRNTFWVLMMMGERIEQWAEFRHAIADWAKTHGCSGRRAMKSLARRGYVKLFKEYQCSHVLLERDL